MSEPATFSIFQKHVVSTLTNVDKSVKFETKPASVSIIQKCIVTTMTNVDAKVLKQTCNFLYLPETCCDHNDKCL